MRTELHRLIAALPAAGVAHATRLGLSLAPEISSEMQRDLLAHVTHLARSATGERHTVTAWLGDLLAYSGALRPGKIAACAAAAGLDAGTLRNAKMVCLRIPVSRRHDTLSWSHHCEVAIAFAKPEEIERWLVLAEAEKLATAELRRRIRVHRATSSRIATAANSAPAFRLMRELRAAARVTEQQRNVWRHWTPSAWRLAFDELQPLVAFVDSLRAARVEHAVVSPCHPGAN